jgi:phosphoglycerate dehydrogenase-like enzyme
VSADVLCLRPESDFHEVGVQPPPDLKIRFAAGPDAVPGADLATARAVVLASVGPAVERAWADRAGRVELVQFTGAGVDRAAGAFTGRPGVVVANVPAANAREVAEYVLLATGSLLRGLALADREIRTGRYREVRGRLTPAAVRSLHSATVGVVGLGQIGLATARLFQAAGAQVGYSDPAPREPATASALGLGRLGLGQLLAASDVVTLHVPLVAATRGLIGAAELRRMPRGAILVNASRGGVVDEAALAAALEDGHLGGAVVDVYAQEPPPPQSPLLALSAAAADRVLYTPHIAGVAYESARRLYTEAWANVRRVLVDGLPSENSVSGAGQREEPGAGPERIPEKPA